MHLKKYAVVIIGIHPRQNKVLPCFMFLNLNVGQAHMTISEVSINGKPGSDQLWDNQEYDLMMPGCPTRFYKFHPLYIHVIHK